ncbi:centrosomal protein of 41 kDa isoform X2 [Hemibagrus wyckioides]|uniref:centrosomal protein of 41 kDa isoform X2 n=1 Tax=Hemibagrus wyckioides TaxID=337641 RepID=UPI00266BDB0F|nr:centrosomal protein of 41 kDa isoform X2 [Hemibagrus wyckioides]
MEMRGFNLYHMLSNEEEEEKNGNSQDPDYRYKKDELFKRLKVTTFAQLVLQVALVSELNESIMDEVPRLEDVASESAEGDRLSDRTDASPRPSPQPDKLTDGSEAGDAAFSPRSTLQSVISGVGELDVDRNGSSSVTLTPLSAPCSAEHPYPDCPYLLLDVRDRELYDQCHIISAHSYPIATLSRTMNPYTKEVLNYRNITGKIIILYDEDERIASQAATTMCERGFENLFMLSGGLKVIAQKFPEGMTTGSFPVSCLPVPTGPSGRKRAALRQMPQPAENKLRFTSEDLNKVQHYLDEVLIPSESSSRLSSTMSISSANSKLSSARSSRLGSGSARSQSSRPWK